MRKIEQVVRQGRAVLEGRTARMLSAAPSHSAAARRRKLIGFEARYADMHRRFDLLRAAGTENTADLKVALEKAIDAFRAEIGWAA